MKKLWSATEFFCILYFFLFSSFLVCSYFPNRKLMDYPQVAGGGWERRLSDSTLPCCLMTLQNSTCEIPHPIWAPAILQDWWAPPSYITPTRQKLFFAFKNPPPPKLAGPSKKWKGKIPQRSSLLSSLLILSWVAPDPPCVWPMNFSTLFIHPPQFFFFFFFSCPAIDRSLNESKNRTDRIIHYGGK